MHELIHLNPEATDLSIIQKAKEAAKKVKDTARVVVGKEKEYGPPVVVEITVKKKNEDGFEFESPPTKQAIRTLLAEGSVLMATAPIPPEPAVRSIIAPVNTSDVHSFKLLIEKVDPSNSAKETLTYKVREDGNVFKGGPYWDMVVSMPHQRHAGLHAQQWMVMETTRDDAVENKTNRAAKRILSDGSVESRADGHYFADRKCGIFFTLARRN